MTNPWTEEAVELLHELVKVKHLTSQQAADRLNRQFGTDFTRNSIIGKATRLWGGMDARSMARVSKARRPAVVPAAVPQVIPADQRDEDHPMAVPLLDCKGCRWPVAMEDTGRHLFCNAPQKPGSSYCAAHAFEAFGGMTAGQTATVKAAAKREAA